jgi:iron uptake system component EfeO
MRAAFVLPVVVAAVLAACASNDTKGAIKVTATDDACKVAKTELTAGSSTFAVSNQGSDVTEVYVYTDEDEVKGEVENVGPGTTRNLNVDLTAGEYQVACKPGMKGDGIRTKITVTGSGGTATAKPSATVHVKAIDYAYEGIDGVKLAKGATVEFVLKNDAPSEEHEMEVFGPDGKAIGEVGPTKPGHTGRVALTLPSAGTYQVRCGIDHHAKKGMKGSFTVG